MEIRLNPSFEKNLETLGNQKDPEKFLRGLVILASSPCAEMQGLKVKKYSSSTGKPVKEKWERYKSFDGGFKFHVREEGIHTKNKGYFESLNLESLTDIRKSLADFIVNRCPMLVNAPNKNKYIVTAEFDPHPQGGGSAYITFRKVKSEI